MGQLLIAPWSTLCNAYYTPPPFLSCYLRFRNATTTYHSLTSCKSLSLALIGMHANVIRRSRGKETRMGNEREREWHKHRNNVSLVSKVYGIYRVPLINKWLTFRFVMWTRVHVLIYFPMIAIDSNKIDRC